MNGKHTKTLCIKNGNQKLQLCVFTVENLLTKRTLSG